MAKKSELLSSYCSPRESAFAAANPQTRFASTVAELQKAVDLANARNGPGQPSARVRGLVLAAAIVAKEDAYWGVAPAIDAFLVAA